MTEAWLPVVGWEGKYEVSNRGSVRKTNGVFPKQNLTDRGYVCVALNYPIFRAKVHRLVAMAFIPNPDNKPTVNHIDFNPLNNVRENLEWCTQAENLHHSFRAGRMTKGFLPGKRSPRAVLSDAQVLYVRELYATGNYSQEELGFRFEISERTIWRIVHMKSYLAPGLSVKEQAKRAAIVGGEG